MVMDRHKNRLSERIPHQKQGYSQIQHQEYGQGNSQTQSEGQGQELGEINIKVVNSIIMFTTIIKFYNGQGYNYDFVLGLGLVLDFS